MKASAEGVVEPSGVVTTMGPTPAVGGTLATTVVAVLETIWVVSTPAKVTEVAPARPSPVMVTLEPATALAGR